jgi:hypothetical protein
MLLEGLVAVVALSTVMLLAPTDALTQQSPDRIYAEGLSHFVERFGVNREFARAFVLLAFATFIYDTLDVATRLASLTPEDLGTGATTLTLRLLSEFGFVLEATGPSIEWHAVFGIYSATIRPTSMIPGQVRLLRSLLAGRETRIGWVILADDQAGTYTAKGVRPPPPSVSPSPSPAPSDPSPSPAAPTVSP